MFDIDADNNLIYKGGFKVWRKSYYDNVKACTKQLTPANIMGSGKALYNLNKTFRNPLNTIRLFVCGNYEPEESIAFMRLVEGLKKGDILYGGSVMGSQFFCNFVLTMGHEKLKLQVANCFGIKKLVTFENYLDLIKDLRNTCAHGNVLYDFTPDKSIRKGPAMLKGIGENQNLNGALRVVLYMMGQISENRYKELLQDFDEPIDKYSKFPEVKAILMNISGLGKLHWK